MSILKCLWDVAAYLGCQLLAICILIGFVGMAIGAGIYVSWMKRVMYLEDVRKSLLTAALAFLVAGMVIGAVIYFLVAR